MKNKKMNTVLVLTGQRKPSNSSHIPCFFEAQNNNICDKNEIILHFWRFGNTKVLSVLPHMINSYAIYSLYQILIL